MLEMGEGGFSPAPRFLVSSPNNKPFTQTGGTGMITDLASLAQTALVEELEQLHREVRQTAESLSEADLWRKPLEPGNSVGHLIMHLTGNLSHFVGAKLGGTGYVRDRDREFTDTQPPSKAEVLAGLDEAVAIFHRVVSGLNAAQLAAPHPETRFGTVFKALLHLVAHFALHRGQMSYIVRLLGNRRD
jgi:uncharacterized damage-inducible protein DinB